MASRVRTFYTPSDLVTSLVMARPWGHRCGKSRVDNIWQGELKKRVLCVCVWVCRLIIIRGSNVVPGRQRQVITSSSFLCFIHFTEFLYWSFPPFEIYTHIHTHVSVCNLLELRNWSTVVKPEVKKYDVCNHRGVTAKQQFFPVTDRHIFDCVGPPFEMVVLLDPSRLFV